MDTPPEFKSGNASFRKALKAVVSYARKHGVNPGGRHGWSESEKGWVPPVTSSDVAATKLGFTVSRSGDDGVKVSPSVVSGASVVARMPTINGTALDATEAPVLQLSANQEAFIALKITIEPESELSGDGVTYKVKDGAGLLIGDIRVEIIGSAEAMEDASELATVDSESGHTATRGVFYVPLAKQESGGRIQNEGYYYGPLGIRLCSSGTLQVIGPIVVVSVES